MSVIALAGITEFGDSKTYNTNQDIRRTIGGDLTINSNWVTTNKIKVKIIALTITQKNTFITLLENNQGLPLTYTDVDGIIYTGLISTPIIEFINNSRKGETCLFQTEFEFTIINSTVYRVLFISSNQVMWVFTQNIVSEPVNLNVFQINVNGVWLSPNSIVSNSPANTLTLQYPTSNISVNNTWTVTTDPQMTFSPSQTFIVSQQGIVL